MRALFWVISLQNNLLDAGVKALVLQGLGREQRIVASTHPGEFCQITFEHKFSSEPDFQPYLIGASTQELKYYGLRTEDCSKYSAFVEFCQFSFECKFSSEPFALQLYLTGAGPQAKVHTVSKDSKYSGFVSRLTALVLSASAGAACGGSDTMDKWPLLPTHASRPNKTSFILDNLKNHLF